MANTSAFVEHVLDLARSAGHVEARPMFGGHGLYVDGRIVGLVIDDTLYLKTDELTQPAFEAKSLPAFEYVTREGQRTVMTYHMAPDEALDSVEAMREWLALAREAALRSAAGKPPKRPRGVKRRA